MNRIVYSTRTGQVTAAGHASIVARMAEAAEEARRRVHMLADDGNVLDALCGADLMHPQSDGTTPDFVVYALTEITCPGCWKVAMENLTSDLDAIFGDMVGSEDL